MEKDNFKLKKYTDRIIIYNDNLIYVIDSRIFDESKIFEKDQININNLKELHLKSRINFCYYYALDLLSKKDYLYIDLKRKLSKKYNDYEIKKVLEKLVHYHYIDDDKFILEYIKFSLEKGFGINKIKCKLLSKNLDLEYINSFINDDLYKMEQEQCFRLVNNLINNKTKNLKKTIFTKLLNKGYSKSTIYSVLSYYNLSI